MRSRRRWSSRRRRGDGVGADDHRGGVAQEPGPQAMPESGAAPRAGRPSGSSHGARSRSVATTGKPRRDRQARADRVVDGPGGPATFRAPAGPDRGPAEHERVDRQRRRTEQPRRGQQAAADHLQVRVARGRVVHVGGEEERERLPAIGSASKAPSSPSRYAAVSRRPGGLLQRPSVEDDAHAGRRGLVRSGAESRRADRRRAAPPRPNSSSSAQLDDDDERLDDDPPRHLALPDATIAERDRHLADPGARPAGTERHLDLEHVAAGVDALERDRREGRRSPCLEPASQVVRSQSQDGPREDRAAARDDPPADPPVDHAAARRIARADDEVGRSVGDRAR